MAAKDVIFRIQAIDKATKPIQNVRKGFKNADASAEGLNKTVKNVGDTIKRAFAALAIFQVGKEILSLGANMEQTQIAFATFLGSAEKGAALVAKLNEFSNVTPFNNAEVINSGRVLLAAGVSADKMTETLRKVGDVAAGTNQPFEEMAAIFAKGMNKGKLQAEELNQFAERGVPILKVLADKWGITKGEVLKMGSEGKITSAVMEEAFTTMTSEGGKFFDLMTKQSASTGGKFSTLLGKLQMVGIGIFDALQPAINPIIDMGIALLENTELLKTIAMVAGVAAGAFALYKVMVLISTASTIGFSGAFAALNAIMSANPLALIAIAIGAFVAAIVVAWRSSETFRGVILGLWEAAKAVFGNIAGVVTGLPNTIISAFKEIPKAIADVFSGVGDLFKAIFTGDFSAVPDILKNLGTNLLKTNPITATALKAGKQLGVGVGTAFGKGFASGADKETEAGIGVGDAATSGTDPAASNSPLGGAGKKRGDLKAGIAGVTAQAPKTFNINIGSLVQEMAIKTTNLQDSTAKIEEEITKVLLTVLRDAEVQSGV